MPESAHPGLESPSTSYDNAGFADVSRKAIKIVNLMETA